jgi:hypothetical protein
LYLWYYFVELLSKTDEIVFSSFMHAFKFTAYDYFVFMVLFCISELLSKTDGIVFSSFMHAFKFTAYDYLKIIFIQIFFFEIFDALGVV